MPSCPPLPSPLLWAPAHRVDDQVMNGHQHDTGRRGETTHGGDRQWHQKIRYFFLSLFILLFLTIVFWWQWCGGPHGCYDHHSTPNYHHEPLLMGWKWGASATGWGPQGPQPWESSGHPLPPLWATACRVWVWVDIERPIPVMCTRWICCSTYSYVVHCVY